MKESRLDIAGISVVEERLRRRTYKLSAERQRIVHSLSGPFLIQDRLAEDVAAATPMPTRRFDPCVLRPAVALDKYQTVVFDSNRYSVQRALAFQMVTVKG
jgi:hypothetical protein